MEDVGAFNGHLVYFTYSHLVYLMEIWYTLWTFGIFCGHLVYFVVIWCIFTALVSYIKKNLATQN
jgi:hypothetical protein